MKNLSLALNGVLLVAVAVLYYLHFSSGSSGASSASLSSGPSNIKVAYINSDTVLKYYDYFKVNRDRLESKGKKLDQDLRNRAENLQKDIESYQRNVGNLTIGQAKAIEEDLAKKQQNLRMYQESLSQELMVDESKMNQDLYAKVTAFLKKYGQENGLQVVLKYDPSSDLLFGGDSLDITQEVIKGLNEAYKSEKVATPADTTA
ncbi:MAG: OmpH family outer membrane protein, partial [Bacteroidota bacterium]